MFQPATGASRSRETLNRAIARVQQATTVSQLEQLITEYVDSDLVLFINKAFEELLNRSESAGLLYGRVRSILEQDMVISVIAGAWGGEYFSKPLRTLEERERSLQVAKQTLKRLEAKYADSVEALIARILYTRATFQGSIEEIGKVILSYYQTLKRVDSANPHLIHFSTLINRDKNFGMEMYIKMINHPEFDRYTLQQRYAAYVGLAQLLYEQKRTREREFYADRFVKYLLARKRIESITHRSMLMHSVFGATSLSDLEKRLATAGYPPSQWRYKPLPKP
jgi:hypothetical protein